MTMREILFRGKRVDNGKWVFGTYGEHTSLDATIIINRPYPTHNGGLSALNFWDVDPATVGQYTGLTDKNGTKIFEGDIVNFKEWSGGLWCWIGEVRYENQQFVVSGNPNRECGTPFTISLSSLTPKRIKVIGNIHDNPELLEVNNE